MSMKKGCITPRWVSINDEKVLWMEFEPIFSRQTGWKLVSFECVPILVLKRFPLNCWLSPLRDCQPCQRSPVAFRLIFWCGHKSSTRKTSPSMQNWQNRRRSTEKTNQSLWWNGSEERGWDYGRLYKKRWLSERVGILFKSIFVHVKARIKKKMIDTNWMVFTGQTVCVQQATQAIGWVGNAEKKRLILMKEFADKPIWGYGNWVRARRRRKDPICVWLASIRAFHRSWPPV